MIVHTHMKEYFIIHIWIPWSFILNAGILDPHCDKLLRERKQSRYFYSIMVYVCCGETNTLSSRLMCTVTTHSISHSKKFLVCLKYINWSIVSLCICWGGGLKRENRNVLLEIYFFHCMQGSNLKSLTSSSWLLIILLSAALQKTEWINLERIK